MVPAPMITTALSFTPPEMRTAWTGVDSGSIRIACRSLSPSGMTCRRLLGMVKKSAMPPCSYPQPKNRRFSHRLLRPVVHILQSQHGSVGSTVTRSPAATPATSAPTALTTPTTSWPGKYGSGTNG